MKFHNKLYSNLVKFLLLQYLGDAMDKQWLYENRLYVTHTF